MCRRRNGEKKGRDPLTPSNTEYLHTNPGKVKQPVHGRFDTIITGSDDRHALRPQPALRGGRRESERENKVKEQNNKN